MQNQTYYTPSSVSRYSSEIPIPPPLPATLGSTSRVGFPPAATTAIPAASIPPPLSPVIPAAATAIPAASYVAPAAVFAEPAQPQFVTAIPPGMPAPLKVETVTPFPEPTPVPFQSNLSHPPAAALTQQTTSTTYQPTAAYTTYYNSPYLAQYSNTPSVATPLSQPVTQPVFVTQTPSAVQASPITVNTSTTYVSPMEVLKAKIVNDLLLLYSGRPSQECFDNYAENAIMNSPLARGVNKTGIEATFACIPKFFTYWQVLNYQVDTTTAANQIFIDYNIRYNWKGGSKKRLHDMISHVVLTLDPHGKILSHEEVWDEGFGFKRKPNKGVSKLQQWISDAGGYITNAFGETRKWNNKMTGWNESHSNRPAPGTYYYTK